MKASYYNCDKAFTIGACAPIEPSANEVRVRVAYCGLCGTDLHVYHGNMDGRVGCERIIGHEMSGTVEAVGSAVTNTQPGDNIVVRPLDHCNDCPACNNGNKHICHNLKFLGLDTDGALQQNWTVPSHTVHKLPADLSLKHAALVEPTAVACHDVNRSRLIAGEDVLIIGGGPIGILIAMVAKARGGNVYISEINTSRIEIAQSLGFVTINPAEVNIGEFIYEKTSGKGAEVIFEVSGSQAGVDCMTEAAAARGRIVMVAIHAQPPRIDLFKFFWREIELLGARVYTPDDFDMAIQMIAEGSIDCDTIITNVQQLDKVGETLADLSGNPSALKSLIQVSSEAA
ncbi:MAG: (R,R)-butanediol dehydrogenase/meso-butanediol dehydrogenase/diacetyl reductase [Parasphingorhabdus sp.]|jgi:(R,R)-butanediol dehydrogenase/meso-butanediol dehydrogenase/diacetyl reductase